VVDGVVYFSTFAHRTYALAAATGRLLWTWPDGEYSPVVTDGRRLYLTGRGRIYALAPARLH
jgi:outer membrane protein assembly factor BamB